LDWGSQPVRVEPPPPPTISGPDTVWWFDGQTPSGYSTSITLSSSGGSSTAWTVTAGWDYVNISESGAQTTVTSTGTAFSLSPGDIEIVASANGQVSDSFQITSRKPDYLSRGITRTDCDNSYGYSTYIYYTVKDGLGDAVPTAVPMNEDWSTGVTPDYTGTNWRRQDPKGNMTGDGAGFADLIQGEAAGRLPTATCDGNATAVQHWGQNWYVGSLTHGVGALVQMDTLQKYRGFADHQ
jgi:hypothetical protein